MGVGLNRCCSRNNPKNHSPTYSQVPSSSATVMTMRHTLNSPGSRNLRGEHGRHRRAVRGGGPASRSTRTHSDSLTHSLSLSRFLMCVVMYVRMYSLSLSLPLALSCFFFLLGLALSPPTHIYIYVYLFISSFIYRERDVK